MHDINIHIKKREGKNTKNEKQEITIMISSTLVVYGDDSLNDFEQKLHALIHEYAI